MDNLDFDNDLILVENLEDSLNWYVSVFGFNVLQKNEHKRTAELRIDKESILRIVERRKNRGYSSILKSNALIYIFEVADIKETVLRIKKTRGSIIKELTTGRIRHYAIANDIDGHEIWLFQNIRINGT